MTDWVDVILVLVSAGILLWLWNSGRSAMPLATPQAPTGAGQRFRIFYNTMLRQAGLRSPHVAAALWIARVLLAILLPLLGEEFAAAARKPGLSALTLLALGVAGALLPDFWVLSTRRTRRQRVLRALSFFLDLVVALLHAGLTLERAVLRAARDGFPDPHPLAEEVLLLGKELDVGQDSTVALTRLAERTGVVELRAVAAAMRMGLRTGSGVEATLERQADLLRVRYREDGLKRINRSSVLTMVPVFLAGVPLYAVIIFFPAVLQFLETWRLIKPQ